jgi:hypothetical protein
MYLLKRYKKYSPMIIFQFRLMNHDGENSKLFYTSRKLKLSGKLKRVGEVECMAEVDLVNAISFSLLLHRLTASQHSALKCIGNFLSLNPLSVRAF